MSKSSPPRKVSPLVAFTSKTPLSSSRMEISKVPPPRSYTATTFSSVLLVFLDETGEHSSLGLDTEREGGHIKKDHGAVVTVQDTTLDGGTKSNRLIGVDSLEGGLAIELLNGVDDLGGTGHTTDQEDLVDVTLGNTGILQADRARRNGALDQVVNQLVVLSTSDGGVEMERGAVLVGEVRDVDVGLDGRRELLLGLLSGLTETLDGHRVRGEIETFLLLELSLEVFQETDVEVLTTEEGITVGGLHLEDTVVELQNEDIEGSTTEIVHSHNLLVGLVGVSDTVSQSGSGGLVDDTFNVETSNTSSILGGLTLSIVEVGRDGNHSLLDGLVEVGLGSLLHLGKNVGSDLRGGDLFAVDLNPSIAVGGTDDLVRSGSLELLDGLVFKSATDQTLGGIQGTGGVDRGLAASHRSDNSLAFGVPGDNRGSSSLTLRVNQHLGLGTFHHGDARVGGTEINTDGRSSDLGLLNFQSWLACNEVG